MNIFSDSQGVKYRFMENVRGYIVGIVNETVNIPEDELIHYANVTSFTATDSDTLTTIIIPEKINGIPIVEIGCAAFAKLKKLEVVQIHARLTQINNFAFYGCENLSSINIPPTVEFIGFCAISAINSTHDTSHGVITIKFEPNSIIKTIEKYGIERKEHIIIYYCGDSQPHIVENSLFHGSTTSIVFTSNPLIKWGNITLAPDPAVCTIMQDSIIFNKQPKNTCNCGSHLFFITLLGIIIILVELDQAKKLIRIKNDIEMSKSSKC